MVSFVHLVSAHGHQVRIDAERNALVSTCDPAPQATIGIVACRLESLSNILFLTAETDEPHGVYLHPHSDPICTVMLLRVTGTNRLALAHAFSGLFVTALPLGTDTQALLHGSAEQIKDWEWFTQAPLTEAAVSQGVLHRLAKVEDLLRHPLTHRHIIDVLNTDRDAADTLNAAMPLIPTETIDRLGQDLTASETLRLQFQSVFAEDLWADKALPDLSSWRQTYIPARMRIGPEFDALGTKGLTGAFTSLPHACALRRRRVVKPGKSLAVVATARNEGLYLLEWIAYHRLLGFDAFFIYSNDNDDGSDALLGALADAGVITWIDSSLDRQIGNAQFKAYGHAFGVLPDLLAFAWALVIDLDEFLVMDRSMFPTVSHFADWHAQRGAHTVAINWQFLGSEENPTQSGFPLTHRNQRLLTEAEMGPGVRLVKSMSRPNRVCHSEAHVPFCDERSGLVTYHAAGSAHRWHNAPQGLQSSPKFSDQILTDGAVIYHYIFKSAEEWLWKNARNRGDHALIGNDRIAPMRQSEARSFLAQHDRGTLEITRRAIDCAPDLLREIERLKGLPRIDDLYRDVRHRYAEKLASLKTIYAASPEVADWDQDARRFLDMVSIASCDVRPSDPNTEALDTRSAVHSR